MEPPESTIEHFTPQTAGASLSSRIPRGPVGEDPGDSATAASPVDHAVTDARRPLPHLSRSARVPDISGNVDVEEGSISSLEANVPMPVGLQQLPNEVLYHILGYLDVNDLLAASRANHLLRSIATAPVLHRHRLRLVRSVLPPLLYSPSRPSLPELITRSIFRTNNSVVSRRLAWSLVSIRLSRRLAARPSAETLVERCVLPQECVPGMGAVYVAPGLVAKRKAIEKERVKDGLRQWIAAKWRGEVKEREEGVRRWEESRGIGRVWKMRRFWERVSRGEELARVRPVCAQWGGNGLTAT